MAFRFFDTKYMCDDEGLMVRRFITRESTDSLFNWINASNLLLNLIDGPTHVFDLETSEFHYFSDNNIFEIVTLSDKTESEELKTFAITALETFILIALRV